MCRKIDYDKDIDSIKEIWKKYHKNKSCKKLIEEIKCSKNDTYVDEKDGAVIAFLTIRNIGEQDEFKNYIFEFYAIEIKKGHGKKLLEKMQDERKCLRLHAKKKEFGLIDHYQTKGFVKYEQFNTDKKYCLIWFKPNTAVKERN